MKNAILAALSLCLSAACAPNAVGTTCTTNADCSDAYSCFREVAGGFCSRGCTSIGSFRDCPANSACAQVAKSTLVCAPTCTDDSQCNSALRCLELPGFDQKVCRQP